jgi:hypothetical protein
MGKFLSDNKTYIVAILIGITTTLNVLNIIDDTQYKIIMGYLCPTGLATMRSSIAKVMGALKGTSNGINN